jgi:uncharacterized membrane protein YhaH (DUF805 family)
LEILAAIGYVANSTAIGAVFTTLGSLFNLATFWPGIAVLIKRVHDRDKSAWFVILPVVLLIPAVIGVAIGEIAGGNSGAGIFAGVAALAMFGVIIWFFVEFGCMRGTIGPNRFGPDPVPNG